MSGAAELAEFLRDLLQPMGHVATKRMFSGAGLWCDGLMFALIVADTVYLKVDSSNKPAFEAEGMGPYAGKSRTVELGYWRLPERLLDEPDELLEWARAALAVARRAASGKRKSRTSEPRQSRTRPRKPIKGKA